MLLFSAMIWNFCFNVTSCIVVLTFLISPRSFSICLELRVSRFRLIHSCVSRVGLHVFHPCPVICSTLVSPIIPTLLVHSGPCAPFVMYQIVAFSLYFRLRFFLLLSRCFRHDLLSALCTLDCIWALDCCPFLFVFVCSLD